MTSYLSSLLTTTTSRYNSLRRSLLSDESDGDTEDDSHISRVLRAYYVEKGRPFPPWLPPDPKSTATTTSQYAQQSRPGPAPQRRTGGGLSDLWDSPGAQQQQQPPTSLRRSGEGMRATQRPQMAGPGDSYASQRLQPTGSRPMRGESPGSFQGNSRPTSSREDSMASQSSAAGSGTAQDRLKAKLWGGRAASPGAGQTGNPYGR